MLLKTMIRHKLHLPLHGEPQKEHFGILKANHV